jgi:hypothetical protein
MNVHHTANLTSAPCVVTVRPSRGFAEMVDQATTTPRLTVLARGPAAPHRSSRATR